MATNNLFANKPTNQSAAGIRIRSEPSLLRAPLNLSTVYAGDLITAQYFNDLVEAILGLEQRVIELESRCYATLKITDVDVGYDDFRFLFDVTGSGLDPGNLASFHIDEEEVHPEGLEGDDGRIRFALGGFHDFNLTVLARGATGQARARLWVGIKISLDEQFSRERSNFTLSIQNKAGATASRGFTLEPSGSGPAPIT